MIVCRVLIEKVKGHQEAAQCGHVVSGIIHCEVAEERQALRKR